MQFREPARTGKGLGRIHLQPGLWLAEHRDVGDTRGNGPKRARFQGGEQTARVAMDCR